MYPCVDELTRTIFPRLIADFSWAYEVFNQSQAQGSFNVAPGTYWPVLHVHQDVLFADDMHWGYRSAWAEASGMVPMAINTQLEKMGNNYWKPLLKRGRVIVLANGWYEWTGEKGNKQPWHIRRTDGSPIYMPALANVAPATENSASNGFTIVTADAQGGMVDVHDRRPVVLSPDVAAIWLDPDLSAEQAQHLLNATALGAGCFEWYQVDRAVGNVRSQRSAAGRPIMR